MYYLFSTELSFTLMITHFSPSHSYSVPDSDPVYFSPFSGFNVFINNLSSPWGPIKHSFHDVHSFMCP